MLKTFFNQSIAAQYIIDNKLPIGCIRPGNSGYNCVEDHRVGGVVIAASQEGCKGSTYNTNGLYRRVA